MGGPETPSQTRQRLFLGEFKENAQGKDVVQPVPDVVEQGLKEDGKYLLSGGMGGLSEEDQDLFYAEGLDPKDVAKMLESARAIKGARALAFESQGEMVVDDPFGVIGGISSTSIALPQGHELGVVDGMAVEVEDPTKLSQGQNSGSGAFVGGTNAAEVYYIHSCGPRPEGGWRGGRVRHNAYDAEREERAREGGGGGIAG